MSVNKLLEELSTVALVQHDVEVRFRAMAAKGSAETGLALLDKLDAALGKRRRSSSGVSVPESGRACTPPEEGVVVPDCSQIVLGWQEEGSTELGQWQRKP